MSYPSSLRYKDSNPWPLEHESSPITTGPDKTVFLPWRVGEVFVNILKGSGGQQEVVHGRIESSRRAPVLSSSDLREQSANVEQDRGLFEGHRSLAARDPVQRVVPEGQIQRETSKGENAMGRVPTKLTWKFSNCSKDMLSVSRKQPSLIHYQRDQIWWNFATWANFL